MHSSPWSCITVGCWRLGWPSSRYYTVDSWFRWSGLEWLVNRSVVTWDKIDYKLINSSFSKPISCLYSSPRSYVFLHFLSTSGLCLTDKSISPLFLHPCIPVTPSTVPPVPPCLPICIIFSPNFHSIPLPFSPEQAVWGVSGVCRPAGPDPHLLQRERRKNPQLLQNSSPLPTVCQQQQTGVYLPKLYILYIYI